MPWSYRQTVGRRIIHFPLQEIGERFYQGSDPDVQDYGSPNATQRG